MIVQIDRQELFFTVEATDEEILQSIFAHYTPVRPFAHREEIMVIILALHTV